MSSGYRADVTIGAYSWTGKDNDAAPVPGYVGVLVDPLTITRYVPDGDLAPNIQQRQEASVTILAEAASTYSFGIGDPVAIVVYTQNVTGGNSVTFYGRVAEVQAQPHKLGVLYTLSCQDYVTDLAEPMVGKVDYPSELSSVRLARVFAESGLGPLIVPSTGGSDPAVGARVAATAGPISLLDHTAEVLSGWFGQANLNELGAATPNVVQTFMELAPNITAGVLDATNPFQLVRIYARPLGWAPSARLPVSPASPRKLTVTVSDTSPATGSQILDAGHVDFAPVFTLRKGNALTRFTVQSTTIGGVVFYSTADWESGIPYYSASKAPLEVTVKSLLTLEAVAQIVAVLYRGQAPPSPTNQWVVGELLWRASRTESANWLPPSLRQVLTIGRVDAVNPVSHSPTNQTWIAGNVSQLRFTIAGGQLNVAITLGPLMADLSPVQNVHLATFASAVLGTTTFAQLSTVDSWLDYLLLYV